MILRVLNAREHLQKSQNDYEISRNPSSI